MDPGERDLEYRCGAVALVLRTLFRNGYLFVLSVAILDDDADLVLRRVIASIGECRPLAHEGFDEVVLDQNLDVDLGAVMKLEGTLRDSRPVGTWKCSRYHRGDGGLPEGVDRHGIFEKRNPLRPSLEGQEQAVGEFPIRLDHES